MKEPKNRIDFWEKIATMQIEEHPRQNQSGAKSMKTIREMVNREEFPVRILQFGEGNFLRAFVDQMVDEANQKNVFNGSIIAVKPRAGGDLSLFEKQDFLFTVYRRGKEAGKLVSKPQAVSCVKKVIHCYDSYEEYMALAEISSLEFVISNTTEAGIVFSQDDTFAMRPPASFPAKATQWLYRRFTHFSGALDKGMTFLPTELIENNGGELKDCILRYGQLWNLGTEFLRWVEEACVFCSTLVDRIVTGYPEDASACFQKLGYEDALLDAAEPFGFWAIEDKGNVADRFPLDKAGLPVLFTQDITPYRERKVRILNGAHTGTAMAGYLAGADTVGECMEDGLIRRFMERLVKTELAPTVPLPAEEAADFTRSAFERFENPYLHHSLLSIALNSVSKWKARLLPSLRDFLQEHGALPPCAVFSFAALLAFYSAGYVQAPKGRRPEIRDETSVTAFFEVHGGEAPQKLAYSAASNASFWGEDLSRIPGFTEMAGKWLEVIRSEGMRAALEKLLYPLEKEAGV